MFWTRKYFAREWFKPNPTSKHSTIYRSFTRLHQESGQSQDELESMEMGTIQEV